MPDFLQSGFFVAYRLKPTAMLQQELFLFQEIPLYLSHLHSNAPARWGTMNACQMLAHLNDFFRLSINELSMEAVTTADQWPKYQAFIYSDRFFRENTKAPMLPDTPEPCPFESIEAARGALLEQIKRFKLYFEENPASEILHPVFGWLNYEGWVRLHYKHCVHHLRQFNLLPETTLAV